MDLYWTGRNIKTMWAMAAIGSACGAMLYGYGTLTGRDEVDGIIAVVLGLYICSHPAAHLVDLLFFRRGFRPKFSSGRPLLWLALNLLVLWIGWFVIFVGTTRLIGRGD